MKALEKDRTRGYQTASDLRGTSSGTLPTSRSRPAARRSTTGWPNGPAATATVLSLGSTFPVRRGRRGHFLWHRLPGLDRRGDREARICRRRCPRQCTVSVDGNEIRIENLGEPIKLRAGQHQLRIRHGDLEIEAREFDVLQRGTQVLHVSIPPAPDEIAGTAPADAPFDASRRGTSKSVLRINRASPLRSPTQLA